MNSLFVPLLFAGLHKENMSTNPRTGTEILESIERVLLNVKIPAPLYSDRKKKSDKTDELFKALGAAQQKFGVLDKSGVIAGRNTPYSKISDLIAAAQKALYDQNLVANTRMIYEQGVVFLVSRLSHTITDQYIESELPLLNNTDEQKRGSSITYAWRYTYAPLIGLVDNSYDDDGEITKGK